MKQMRRSDSGITLVELMVSMVVLGFAISAAFGITYTLLGGFADNERVLQAQRGARGAIDVIADAVRGSSPGVTTGAIQDLAPLSDGTCSGNTDAMTVSNGTGTAGSDVLVVVHASGGVLGFLQEDLDSSKSELVVNAENDDFRDGLYFEVGDLVVVTNGTNGHLFQIDDLEGPDASDPDKDWKLKLSDQISNLCSSPTLTEPFFSGGNYPAGSMVIRARRSRFSICDVAGTPYMILGDDDGDCDVTATDFEPIAEGIEDLQLAVALDGNGDGEIDVDDPGTTTDELHYNAAGDAVPTGLSTSPRWSALRVTVAARTTDEAQQGTGSTPQDLEDNDVANTADEYRRRTMTTVLELRNIQN